MINVLVTGGNGQLGTCIRDVAIDYSGLNLIYTDYTGLDICNLNQLQVFFKANQNIDFCVNCAAYTAVDKAEVEIDKAFAINAEGPKNLALVCLENNTTLIQISTDFVFEGNKTEPYKENEDSQPVSVYGKTKLKGEEEVRNILGKYFILRTSWLYSEHGGNFMKTMLRLAETRDELSVVNDQIGSPTYAKDLANAILSITISRSKEYGTYHYSNGGVASWYDFAKAIFEESNVKISLLPISTLAYPTPAKRPKYSVLNTSKIKNLLGIEISHWKISLDSALLGYKRKVVKGL
jgi:dTDP-4-dehydrorhamnose reductase